MADAIKAHLPRGGTFWDVGANIGLISLFASKIAGPNVVFRTALGMQFAWPPMKRLFFVLTRLADSKLNLGPLQNTAALGSY
jgi:hypothetical protein